MKLTKEVFVFIGPPGSGKGSLSHLCAKKWGWKKLSTGDLCRQHIANKTAIGQQIDFIIKSGKLISDRLIVEMVEEWLLNHQESCEAIILDGFPRTVIQAQAFDEALKKAIFSTYQLNIVKMSLADETVVSRLMMRLICQNGQCQAVYSQQHRGLAPQRSMICNECLSPLSRRADDEVESIRERLKIYHQHSHDLTSYYIGTGRSVEELSVERSIDEVFNLFASMIGRAIL